MQKLIAGAVLALALASGQALAQATPPAANAAAEAKFKAADKNSNGMLEGAELDAYKSAMTQADSNKDGKISRDEFAAATKAGHIK